MEFYQSVQNRAAQTAAVIRQVLPTLSVGGVTVEGLLGQSQALEELAQRRDDALADFDAAGNAENQGFLALRALTLTLPKAAQANLEDGIAAETTLLDLLAPVYAVDPRNTELAQKRGKKLVSALHRINDYLTGLTPARAPVSSAGRGVAELEAAMSAQPALVQALEDAATAVSTARSALRTAATNLDRLNKRFYAALKAEARSHALLSDALAQISIAGDNHPATLSIRSLVQGGTDDRQVLINYVGDTYDGSTTSSVEWLLKGVDTGFAHSVAVDPSGNAIGPFAAGQIVQLRTRVRNANGSTTGSVRTLTIL
jgi:hypothetical protein